MREGRLAGYAGGPARTVTRVRRPTTDYVVAFDRVSNHREYDALVRLARSVHRWSNSRAALLRMAGSLADEILNTRIEAVARAGNVYAAHAWLCILWAAYAAIDTPFARGLRAVDARDAYPIPLLWALPNNETLMAAVPKKRDGDWNLAFEEAERYARHNGAPVGYIKAILRYYVVVH